MRTFRSAWTRSRLFASVLITQVSTPVIPSSTRSCAASEPAPPRPITANVLFRFAEAHASRESGSIDRRLSRRLRRWALPRNGDGLPFPPGARRSLTQLLDTGADVLSDGGTHGVIDGDGPSFANEFLELAIVLS